MEINTQDNLISETKRWLKKIRIERKSIKTLDQTKNDFLKNIDAYISDSQHFLDQKEYIEAFEAVIWAWAYLEIGEQLQILKRK